MSKKELRFRHDEESDKNLRLIHFMDTSQFVGKDGLDDFIG